MESHEIEKALIDLNCDKETIEKALEYSRTQNKKEQIKLLVDLRKKLLDAVHDDEKKISIIDYLLYRIRQTNAD